MRALTLLVALVAMACVALAAYSYRQAEFATGLIPSAAVRENPTARAELLAYLKSTQCPPQVIGLLESGWKGQELMRRVERGYVIQIASRHRNAAYTLGALSVLLLGITWALARKSTGSRAT